MVQIPSYSDLPDNSVQGESRVLNDIGQFTPAEESVVPRNGSPMHKRPLGSVMSPPELVLII